MTKLVRYWVIAIASVMGISRGRLMRMPTVNGLAIRMLTMAPVGLRAL